MPHKWFFLRPERIESHYFSLFQRKWKPALSCLARAGVSIGTALKLWWGRECGAEGIMHSSVFSLAEENLTFRLLSRHQPNDCALLPVAAISKGRWFSLAEPGRRPRWRFPGGGSEPNLVSTWLSSFASKEDGTLWTFIEFSLLHAFIIRSSLPQPLISTVFKPLKIQLANWPTPATDFGLGSFSSRVSKKYRHHGINSFVPRGLSPGLSGVAGVKGVLFHQSRMLVSLVQWTIASPK